MKCELCGANPATDTRVALIRQNPTGVKGIWRCLKCNTLPVAGEVQDIINVVQEPPRDDRFNCYGLGEPL